jgi:hypothetical protein
LGPRRRALLTGTEEADALGALDALSRRYLSLESGSVDPSLTGHAGLAMVHGELDRVFPGRGHWPAAKSLMKRAAGVLAEMPASPGLHDGFAGTAWVLERIAKDPRTSNMGDPCAAIDEALVTYLDQSPWREPIDLYSGLVGLGVYGLERLPRASGRRVIAHVVERLAETASRVALGDAKAEGVAWRWDPKWPPGRRQNVEYDLGVAHGIAGVIALLGRVCSAPLGARTRSAARHLLEGAVPWLLAQQLPKNPIGCFPGALGQGIAREPTRVAWCYGDLGVAAALHVAARHAKVPAWGETAIAVALRAAARTERTGVVDAGLCHGAAGNAHIFHRLYIETRDRRLGAAARRWFAETLAMRRRRGGFAGFVAHVPSAGGKLARRPDPAFLAGAGGVALALAAAVTTGDASWDSVLLLS